MFPRENRKAFQPSNFRWKNRIFWAWERQLASVTNRGRTAIPTVCFTTIRSSGTAAGNLTRTLSPLRTAGDTRPISCVPFIRWIPSGLMVFHGIRAPTRTNFTRRAVKPLQKSIPITAPAYFLPRDHGENVTTNANLVAFFTPIRSCTRHQRESFSRKRVMTNRFSKTSIQ